MQHRSTRAPAAAAPRRPGRVARAIVAAATVAAAPAALSAQAAPGRGDECYGFAFGRWTPALDQAAAGHRPVSPADVAHAPGGRDWAAAVASGRDTTLLLFPAWWPAGIHVAFPGGVRTPTDTVRGRAVALVADGRVRNPEAEVLAWPVSCAGSAPDRGAGRVMTPRPAPVSAPDSTPRPARPRPPRPDAPGAGRGSSGR